MSDIAGTREEFAAAVIAASMAPGNTDGGGLSVMNVTGGSALVSQDLSGNAPETPPGVAAIDIQATRAASTGALCPDDIVFGAQSGGIGTPAAVTGQNIIIGWSTTLALASTQTAYGNLFFGNSIVKALNTGASVHDAGGDAVFGNSLNLTGTAGNNLVLMTGGATVVQNTSTLTYSKNVLVGYKINVTFDGTSASSANTFLGGSINAYGTLTSCLALGDSINIGQTGIVHSGCTALGHRVQLTNGFTNRTRIGVKGTTFAAYMDIVGGTSVNTSSIVLGVDTSKNLGTTGSNNDGSSGANVIYQFALADQGKVKDNSTTTALTIPDNCSTFLITGASAGVAKTYTFPANPIDGQLLSIGVNVAPSSITLSGGAHTLIDGTLTAAVGTTKKWIYDLTDTTWYRA